MTRCAVARGPVSSPPDHTAPRSALDGLGPAWHLAVVTRIPPPALALGAAVAQRVLTRHAAPSTLPGKAAAGITATASGALANSAAGLFRRRGTTLDPFHPDTASVLVTTGAFAITRNPMYVGLAGLLVSNAIRRGSWRALVPVVGFVLVIDRWQIPAEEAALRARFGADYQSYCADVPRWLGPGSVGPLLRS